MKTSYRFTYHIGTFSNTVEGLDLYRRILRLLRPSLPAMLKAFKAEKARFSRRSSAGNAFTVHYHIWA